MQIKYECPLTWNNLKETALPNVCFCDKCQQEVLKSVLQSVLT